MLGRSMNFLRKASPRKNFWRGFKAAIVSELGKIEVKDMKHQSPRESQILVEVESSGFNPADSQMIKGTYHLKPKLPFVPGFEFSGNIKAVGKKIKKWREGDRVLVIRSNGTGAFAEECLVDANADLVVRLPYSIDYETAAAITTSYATAYIALQKMAAEKQGAQVLVLSSRGMIAFAAIDLAQNIFKASVLAASDDEEKLEKLRETGVQRTINYTKEDLVRTVHAATFGHGVDVVVDTVGGNVFSSALQCVRVGGTVLSLGMTSGEIPSISLLDLHRSQASVSGVWLGGRRPEELENVVGILLNLFEQNYLTPRIEARYPLREFHKCIQDIRGNKLFGKVLINPKD